MDKTDNIKLVKPSPAYLESYLEACRGFKRLGLLSYSFNDPDEYEIWGSVLFQRLEEHSRGVNLMEGFVPSTTFWLVDSKSKEFIGEGNIRHELTARLTHFGGHIGYAIRASEWNKGYGTLQLSLLLLEASRLNIKRVLITCNDENIGSQRVIEKNGGKYQDTITNTIDGRNIHTRRYWVDTPPLC